MAVGRFNPLNRRKRTIVQQYGDWYTGRRWAGCYIWYYSEEGPGRAVCTNFILCDVAL